MHYISQNALSFFGQTYGAGAYDTSTYQENSITSTGGSTGSNGSTGSSVAASGPLTNTGFDMALIMTLACASIFVALAVRLWKRPGKQQPDNQIEQ